MRVDSIRSLDDVADFSKVARPALEAFNLPPRVFHDPAIYAREMATIFGAQWICVGRLEDFAAEGPELVRVVDTDEVRLHRSSDGSIDGNVRVATWNGFIFVNRDDSAPPLAENLSETFKWGAENYALADERSVHRFEWECAANWKLLVENFVEEYHVAWVHADSFHPTMPMQKWEAFPDMTSQPWTYMFGPFHETSMGTEGPAQFPIIETLSERERSGMGIVTIYPNLMLILAVDCLIYYYVLPEAIDKTRVVAHLCLPNKVADRVEAGDRTLMAAFQEYVDNTELILDEDMAASDRQSIGLGSRFAQAGRVCRHELLLSNFHHWLLKTAYSIDATS